MYLNGFYLYIKKLKTGLLQTKMWINVENCRMKHSLNIPNKLQLVEYVFLYEKNTICF